MFQAIFKATRTLIGVGVLLIISACTPYYINTQNLGTPANAKEIQAFLAGTFFTDGSGGSFCGRDGQYKVLSGRGQGI